MQQEIDHLQKAAKFFAQKRYVEALVLYEQLAEQDHPNCQVFVGWMYHEGLGTKKDDDKALRWFEKAARSGSEKGMFYYGKLLTMKGELKKSFAEYQKSAAMGYAPALYRLGIIYAKGVGVDKNLTLADDYFLKAAARGHIFAKREIALRYLTGSHGLLGRLEGVGLFTQLLIDGIRSILKNKYSDELKG